ncbi:PAS domain S-box protein [Telluribacter sp.]|jgi:PAS domain S-box-containing protein|uniref:PAS domain S-box protein n=1 Tax=Telluribacter sp. TaxID=1978767 RepID=UPI002E103DEC|nr:PAS domain S-box protein [Telluribacter sp.]
MNDVYECFYLNASEGIISTDADFSISSLNPAAIRILQVGSEQEVIGKDIQQSVIFHTIEYSFQEIFYLLRQSGRWTGRISYHLPDGGIVLLSGNFYALRSKDEEVQGYNFQFGVVSDPEVIANSLLHQQEQYNTFLSTLAEGMIVHTHTDLVLCNPAVERIIGLSSEQLLGREPIDPRWHCIHEDGSPFPFETHPSVITLQTGQALRGVIMGVYQIDGSLTWISINSEPVFEPGANTPTAVVVSFSDITGLIKAEQAIKETEQRWHLALEGSGIGVWDWKPQTQEIYMSPQHLQLLGLPGNHTTLDMNEWTRLIHPDDVQLVVSTLEKHLTGDDNYYRTEHRIRQKNGTYRWVLNRGSVVERDAQGQALRMIGTTTDISERKRIEKAETKISQRFIAIFNSMYQFIGLLEPNGTIIEANETALVFAGVGAGDVIGKPLWEGPWFSYSDDLQKEIEADVRKAAQGEFIRREIQIVGKDEQRLFIDFSLKPVWDDKGKVILLIPEGRDITGLKQTEQLLQEANEKLAKRAEALAVSNAELERFAYVASHDLQEPLRTVNMFLELLEKKYSDRLDDNGRRYILTVKRAAERMKNLIQDLLQYARIGNMNTEVRPINSKVLVQSVVEAFQKSIIEKSAEVIVHDLPNIKGEDAMIYVLFQNLIGNGLKYNTSQRPVVEVGSSEEGGKWVFYVKDNGIGIEEEYFEKIFVIFQRLHKKDEYSGTGIGLAICKRIVERHQGHIWLESGPYGTTFYFSINKKLKNLATG